MEGRTFLSRFKKLYGRLVMLEDHKYLPPKFQKRIFYPALWTEDEKENWGKGWVEEEIKTILKGA